MRKFPREALALLISCLAIAPMVQAIPTIYGIRYGAHPDFDRVVFEISEPVDCRIESVDPDHLRIHLGHVVVSPRFRVATLPKKTVSVLSAKAFGGGEDPFIVNIRIRGNVKTSLLKLGGSPSRIAVDITPTQAVRPPEEEPDYIPGDRPLPTKFAETIAPPTEIDEAKIHSILAYYFLAMGDTVQALREATAYEAATGEALDLTLEAVPTASPLPAPVVTSPSILFEWLKVDYLIAFLAGILGYAFASLLVFLVRRQRPRDPRVQAEELMERAHKIREVYDEATAGESRRKIDRGVSTESAEASPAEEAVQEGAAPEPSEVQSVKDSATERRAKRVMELANSGKTVADIAQDLQMSQDEVKLILDLNQ
jgi:hypothetical protein